MDKTVTENIKSLILLFTVILSVFIFVPIGIFILHFFITTSDFYNRNIFTKEIKKDIRMEKIVYLKRPKSIVENEFDIVIELKNGKRIGGCIESSIYKFHHIKVIDNYKLYTLSLVYYDNNSKWYLSYNTGIRNMDLRKLLNKPSSFGFQNDINTFINCYDEIKELVEKIYTEGPIPGGKENLEEWAEKEALEQFTGYFESSDNTLGNWKTYNKIYIEYVENEDDYDLCSNEYYFNKFKISK